MGTTLKFLSENTVRKCTFGNPGPETTVRKYTFGNPGPVSPLLITSTLRGRDVMRSRNLKPGYFKNEILCELDPLARILFSGLWCMADREGRLEYRPKRIKVEILPYDNCNIEKLLLLLSRDFITIYEVDGEKYIQINKFKEHQNPHIKEKASTIPAPEKYSASTVQAPEEHGSRPADSLLRIPESPLPITESPLPITDSRVIAESDKNHSPPPAPFISIPLNDKTEFVVTFPMIEEWKNLFPKVDIEQELREIRAWNMARPRERKTRKGILKHITTWLAKEQDRGGNGNGTISAYSKKSGIRSTHERESDAEIERITREYYASKDKETAATDEA